MATLLLILISMTQATMLTGDEAWPSPIGIPTPPFGIEETYRMYDAEPNRNPALTYNVSPDAGYYTHYIDSSDTNATNTSNSFGSPAKPRLTIPRNLPAGSIVEVHNNVNYNGGASDVAFLTGIGTENYPIFVRGVGEPNIPLRAVVGYPEETHYMIVEGMTLKAGKIQNSYAYTLSHISIRNCEFTNPGGGGGLNVQAFSTGFIDYCVLYNNAVHDYGNWMSNEDNDTGATSIGEGVRHCWIVDNEFYHIDSSGFVVCPGNQGILNDDPMCPRFIYVGRNKVHHNRQSGIWSKTGLDVIFSQNTCYGNREAGGGLQYDPKRVWFLFNRIYDLPSGLETGSPFGKSPRDEFYFIGNLIYNCSSQGFSLNNLGQTTPVVLMCNTIYNCPSSIKNGYYNVKTSIVNNIFAGYTHAINFSSGYTSYQMSNMDYNLLDGSGNIIWGSAYANLAAFAAGTNQGDNCIETDPLFVNPGNSDFSLQEASPFHSMAKSPEVQSVFKRFYELYGIDISNGKIENTDIPTEPDVPDTQLPVVNTLGVENIGQTTAKFVGLLEDDGFTKENVDCACRFLYWKYKGEVSIKTTDWISYVSEGRTFNLSIGGLEPGTVYFVMAEAMNYAGTSQGDEETFITLPDPNKNPPVPFDPNFPNAIEIQHINKFDPNNISQQVLTYSEDKGNSVLLDLNDIDYAPTPGDNAKIISLICVPTGNPVNYFDVHELSTDFRPETSDTIQPDAIVELTMTGNPDLPLMNKSALRFWINNNVNNSDLNVSTESFNGKPLTIQRKSFDPNIIYPVWDIRELIAENDSEMPLYFIITDDLDPNVIINSEPNASIKIIEKNIPYEWLTLSTSRQVADIDGSGIIDLTDQTILLRDLGKLGILRGDIACLKKHRIILGIPDGEVNVYDEIAFIIEYNKMNPYNEINNPYGCSERFESGQIQEPFTTSGDLPWNTSTNSYEGNFCIKSGNISNNKRSILEITENVQFGNIYFWKKVSCEPGYDNLIFYIDDTEAGRWSGELDWEEVNFQVTPGVHNIKWMYQKDASIAHGEDAAFLDNINIF